MQNGLMQPVGYKGKRTSTTIPARETPGIVATSLVCHFPSIQHSLGTPFCRTNSITCSLEYTDDDDDAGTAAAAAAGPLLPATIVVVKVAAASITLKHALRSTRAVLSVVDKVVMKGDGKSAYTPAPGEGE